MNESVIIVQRLWNYGLPDPDVVAADTVEDLESALWRAIVRQATAAAAAYIIPWMG